MYVSKRYDQTLGEHLLNEANLWEEFRRGDKAAMALIYTRYYPILLAYGKKQSTDKELVKDCVQDLFAELIRYRNNVSPTTSIKFYLYRSLNRKLIKKINKELLQEPFAERIHDGLEHSLSLPEEEVIINSETSESMKYEVLHALDRLTKKQKKAVQLKFYRNLSYPEIASAMSISVASVYNLCSKAIQLLQSHFKKK
jgi:RNA polymerase sigma factor (sigma-70 family)